MSGIQINTIDGNLGAPGATGATGAAGAAGAAGVVPDAGTTSLSTTHYTATLASRPNPLTAGYAFMVAFNATNLAASDIALSSGTAQPLYSNGAALPAGAIVAGCPYLCRSNGTQVEVLGIVPSTLGATTFSGDVAHGSNAVTGVKWIDLTATSSTTGPGSANFGIWASTAISGRLYLNVPSTCYETYFTRNGSVTFAVNHVDNAVLCRCYMNTSNSDMSLHNQWSGRGLSLGASGTWGAVSFSNGAGIDLKPSNHATYPGAHQSFAPLTTRAASTAVALCPVATGNIAEVKIQETQYAGSKVFVDAAGAVTLYSPIYGTVNAAWVNSASPGAAEIGCYISAGVLYFKYGSGGTGKMASFSQIGKA